MKTIIIDGVEYTLTPTKQEKELFIGELNGKRYYLGPEADEKLNWFDAVSWCKLLGENYELPTRVVLLMCYDVMQGGFRNDSHYWSASERDSSSAWSQNFANGNQTSNRKIDANYVRAVRVESTK